MDKYVNIHVHAPQTETNIVAVSAVCIQSAYEVSIPATPTSLGLHPWHITPFLETTSPEKLCTTLFTTLETYLHKHPSIKMIGEIGLDKAIHCSLDVQKAVFVTQLQCAQQHRVPVVIHCVRAYNEIVELIKQQRMNVPIIFHGFNGSVQMAQQLVAKGYYISLGVDLLQKNVQRFNAILQQIPAAHIVFETDTHPNQQITSVYDYAHSLTGFDFVGSITLSVFNI